MQLCLNSSCFCSPFETGAIPLPEKIDLAYHAGYRLIELWIKELEDHQASGGDVGLLKKQLDDLGMRVPSVITLVGWMGTAGDEYEQSLAECRHRMELAAAVGSPRIVATPETTRQPAFYHLDMDETAARYRELLELGADLGVKPMMEFLGFVGSVYQLEQAEAIVELADHPDATLVLDPFHLWRGGSSFKRIKSLPVERIGICHFNDAPADNPPRFQQVDGDRVYPGDGDLPLVQMIRDLTDIGYDGPLSLELFNARYWAMDPGQNLRLGLMKTQQILEAAGL